MCRSTPLACILMRCVAGRHPLPTPRPTGPCLHQPQLRQRAQAGQQAVVAAVRVADHKAVGVAAGRQRTRLHRRSLSRPGARRPAAWGWRTAGQRMPSWTRATNLDLLHRHAHTRSTCVRARPAPHLEPLYPSLSACLSESAAWLTEPSSRWHTASTTHRSAHSGRCCKGREGKRSAARCRALPCSLHIVRPHHLPQVLWRPAEGRRCWRAVEGRHEAKPAHSPRARIPHLRPCAPASSRLIPRSALSPATHASTRPMSSCPG